MLSEQEKITRDFYNKNGAGWAAHHMKRNLWQVQHEQFKNYLATGKVIDIGCGSGNDAKWFLENNYDYLGTDASETMLAEARKNFPNAKFLLKNFYELDFPENSFDGFWSACALLHVPKDRIKDVFASVLKIVKPGATGFISIKQGNGEVLQTSKTFGDQRFFAFYKDEEFTKVLEESGFKVLKIGQVNNPDIAGEIFLCYFVTAIK